MNVAHFASATAFRRWLMQHQATTTELWVGFYRKDSGRGGLTYPEALDEALCFGWIDGIRKKVSTIAYTNRFTPRRSGSIWSNVNVRHVARLTAAGRMHATGLAAFAARDAKKTGIYSFEQRPDKFPASLEAIFRATPVAWKFWLAQPPGYRRTLTWFVVSAKQDATRRTRLARLIAVSARSERLG